MASPKEINLFLNMLQQWIGDACLCYVHHHFHRPNHLSLVKHVCNIGRLVLLFYRDILLSFSIFIIIFPFMA